MKLVEIAIFGLFNHKLFKNLTLEKFRDQIRFQRQKIYQTHLLCFL